ncbi:hypothetical protein [Kitasatospora viridis]|uniref:Uncharacterized protein n=1 Tax=Kitasatospora viridis TaxID=281105 RepID=A0A561SA18_9ACTN|nr:hypothetical protein [Kitasatospora viridis]TWF71723.1 hypothetical protein FHX73_1894 [Kitasatospora viridis]
MARNPSSDPSRSELAIKIVEALNGNLHWASYVDVPTDQDIHVGPLVFRFGGGPHRDRWYIAGPADVPTN